MFTLTAHAIKQASEKGIEVSEVLSAANRPTITYANGRVPGQVRHIRGDLVTVVDPVSERVITLYRNVVETDIRPDQTDKDAKRYAVRRGQKARAARKVK